MRCPKPNVGPCRAPWPSALAAIRIAAAYASGGYTMREIGDYFGLHYSRISKILRRALGSAEAQSSSEAAPNKHV